MADKKQEIASALVQLAWADNQLTPEETELLGKYLRQLGFDEEASQQAWLTNDKPVDYETLRQLMPESQERLQLMRDLLTLSFSDDSLCFEEFELLEKMAESLEISDEQMETLRQEVTQASSP